MGTGEGTCRAARRRSDRSQNGRRVRPNGRIPAPSQRRAHRIVLSVCRAV